MEGARRFLLSFLAVGLLHLVAAACMLLISHDVLMAKYFGACALLTAAVGLLSFHLLRLPPPNGEGRDEGPPRGGPAGPEPPHWWPEFEREFWRHVDSGPRTPAAR